MSKKKPLTPEQIRRNFVNDQTADWAKALDVTFANRVFEGYHEVLIGIMNGQHEAVVRQHWFTAFNGTVKLPVHEGQFLTGTCFGIDYIGASKLILEEYKEKLCSRLYELERRF